MHYLNTKILPHALRGIFCFREQGKPEIYMEFAGVNAVNLSFDDPCCVYTSGLRIDNHNIQATGQSIQ